MCRSMFACLALLLSPVSALSALSAQPVPPEDKQYFQAYRRADPITNWPLKKVLHQIPELKGLEPATDQSRLPEVLRGVSASLRKFAVNFAGTDNDSEFPEPAKLSGVKISPWGI
jgi:hypothetical protein